MVGALNVPVSVVRTFGVDAESATFCENACVAVVFSSVVLSVRPATTFDVVALVAPRKSKITANAGDIEVLIF